MEDLPFDIPDSWTWIRLNSISTISAGGTPDRGNPKYWNGSIPWLKISDITSSNKYVNKSSEFITEEGMNNSSAKLMTRGTILYTIFATIGKVGILDFEATCNQAIAGISTYLKSIDEYLYLLLVNLQDYMKSISKGCAQFNINQKILKETIVALPPLNEQTRIVNKINSCELLIEQYSAAEEKLSKIEQEFPEKLKKSILQYAIEGKLVKQDPNEEPASVLLERIKTEKEKLIKEGKIKRDKNESYIYQGDDKNYYEKICLRWPSNWVALPLKSVLIPMQSCKPQGEYFRYIDIEAVDNKNQVISNPKIMRTKNAPSRANRKLHTGDVIFSIVRPYLKNIALISENYSDCIGSTGFYVCSPLSELNSSFLYYFLLSPYCIDGIMPFMKGDNSPSIRGEDLEKLIIGLPSNNEQDKIIKKLESIIALI